MRLDDSLNLVMPIRRRGAPPFYVHSMPISREVYETYYMVLGKAFSALYEHNLKWVSGPKVAALLIRDAAKSLAGWDAYRGVNDGLMPEIRRLTNVLLPSPNGFEPVPFQVAIDQKLITENEIAEIEGKVCFFTLVSTMHPPEMVPGIMEIAGGLWGTQVSSLTFMEFRDSLKASASEETTTPPADSSAKSSAT